MMQRIQLRIKPIDGQRMHSNWGYTLYGILSQNTDANYIAQLHQRNETPLSQYLETLPETSEAIWHINLLGEEAIYHWGASLKKQHSYQAAHHHTVLQVLEQNWEEPVSEHNFCYQYLVEHNANRLHKLHFLTPVGFKSQNQYQIFPTIELMLKSLWRSWQNYSQELKLDDDMVRDQLIQYTKIWEYQLKSARYPVKGNKIPAFRGDVVLSVHGPEPLARLVQLLLAFGEYSGMGMKTALGMGGYRLER